MRGGHYARVIALLRLGSVIDFPWLSWRATLPFVGRRPRGDRGGGACIKLQQKRIDIRGDPPDRRPIGAAGGRLWPLRRKWRQREVTYELAICSHVGAMIEAEMKPPAACRLAPAPTRAAASAESPSCRRRPETRRGGPSACLRVAEKEISSWAGENRRHGISRCAWRLPRARERRLSYSIQRCSASPIGMNEAAHERA